MKRIEILFDGQPVGESHYMSSVGSKDYELRQNYPNPFASSTTIEYHVSVISDVTLTVYDLLGRKVRTLVDESAHTPGKYELQWRAGELSSGTYFYRMIAVEPNRENRYMQDLKLMLVK